MKEKEKELTLDHFQYHLPKELIAQTPIQKRDQSRLMVLKREGSPPPIHTTFRELPKFLKAGDLLVFNDTKVIPARLHGKKPTGGKVELLLIEPAAEEKTEAPQKVDELYPIEETTRWWSLAKSSKPLKSGQIVLLPEEKEVVVLEKREERYLIQFPPDLRGKSLLEYLDRRGEMPLPPYIDPKSSEVDHHHRYQTIFASKPGAIAAPTAGLHFTPHLLDELKSKGVKTANITLHVGLGTFLPVRERYIKKHKMHREKFYIPPETAQMWRETREKKGRIVAVGTTALRALESAWREPGALQIGPSSTDLFIYPGYQFKAVDALITNFHLPGSTLLMLVSAFYDRRKILDAYAEAIEKKYRFYSYGDAMLIM